MQRARVLLALLLGVWLLAPTFAQRRQPPPPYRILVSNDDGVRAPGLAALAQVLQAIGEVTIVAPAENQSGKGHSIVTSEPIFRDDITLPNGMKAIGLTATPEIGRASCRERGESMGDGGGGGKKTRAAKMR